MAISILPVPISATLSPIGGRPAYYTPPPVAYSETESYTYRRPVQRHRRTVSHRVCSCK